MPNVVITEASRKQIAELVEKASRVLRATKESRESIYGIMSRALGKGPDEAPGSPGFESKYGYRDKYGNNLGAMWIDVGTLADAEYFNNPHNNEEIASIVKGWAAWREEQSDKPAYERETRPNATKRSLANLEGYIKQHEAAFTPEDKEELSRHIAGSRRGLMEIAKCCGEAQRLHDIIAPKGQARG